MMGVLEISRATNGFIAAQGLGISPLNKYSRNFELFIQRFHDCENFSIANTSWSGYQNTVLSSWITTDTWMSYTTNTFVSGWEMSDVYTSTTYMTTRTSWEMSDVYTSTSYMTTTYTHTTPSEVSHTHILVHPSSTTSPTIGCLTAHILTLTTTTSPTIGCLPLLSRLRVAGRRVEPVRCIQPVPGIPRVTRWSAKLISMGKLYLVAGIFLARAGIRRPAIVPRR